MARFAATGRRFRSTVGTGLDRIPTLSQLGSRRIPMLPSTPVAPAASHFQPFRPSFKAGENQRRLSERRSALRGMGLSEDEATSAIQVEVEAGKRYQRPSAFLGIAGRVLGAGESTIAGTILGFTKYLRHKGYDENEVAPPWVYVAALGAGFKDIPKAVGEGQNFHDLIMQTQDPNSFLYKHSKPIGLGMSVFFDPLTYVSFGTTAASKIAARTALTYGWRQSFSEAEKLMASKAVGKGADIDKIAIEQHLKNQRAFTLGDALLDLHKLDRAGTSGRFRQVFARGGQGTRFAGKEIPGTARLGQASARALRGRAQPALSREVSRGNPVGVGDEVLKGFSSLFVPEAKLKSITDDVRRSMAMSDWREFVNSSHGIADDLAINFGRRVQEISDPEIKVAMGLAGTDRAFIPRVERMGALRRPKGELSDASKQMVNKIELRVASVKSKAKRSGFEGNQLKHFDDLWDKMKMVHDDPVTAVTDYLMRSGSRILTHGYIQKMLANPVYARPIRTAAKKAQPIAVGSVEEMAAKTPGQGWVPFKYKGKEYAVAEEIAETFDELRNPMFLDAELSKVFRAINWPQNKWKILATSPNMSFHVMNFVGAVWNNALGGVYNPIDYVHSIQTLYRGRLGRAAEEGQQILGRVPEMTVERAEAVKMMGEATKRGGLGRSSFVFAELTRPTKELEIKASGLRRLTTPGSNVRGKTPIQRGARLAATRGRQAAGLTTAAMLNPLAAILLLPEITRAGRTMASVIEDTVRLAPFHQAARDKSTLQLLEAYGPTRIPGLKNHDGFSKAQQEEMYDIGASMARHFQFDYMDLTQFERRFAKSVFPFYVWFRKNMALQTKEMINRPRFVETAQKVENFADSEGVDTTPEFKNILPEYFDQLDAFQVPMPKSMRAKLGLPADDPLYLNPKLPFVTLNLYPPVWNLFRDTDQPTAQRWGSLIAPFAGMVGPFSPVPVPGAKLMLEAWTNYQFGLNRPIDYQKAQSGGWRQNFVPAPGWVQHLPKPIRDAFGIFPFTDFKDTKKGVYMTATSEYLLNTMTSPFITNLGNAIPVGGEGTAAKDKARADLVSWMTGVRLMPVDPLKIHRSFGYRMENMLEAKKAELKDQGKRMDPEDEVSLKMLRAHLRVIESSWDQREKELYGP